MCVSIEKEDSRKTKTRKTLYSALYLLLGDHYFGKITVTDICEEALVSRATFYAYFLDKYDLLKYWLVDLWSEKTNGNSNGTYDQMKNTVNHYIYENKSILNHLVYDADNEALNILFDFILSTLNVTIEKNDSGEVDSKDVVLSNFYAGGMIYYLLWQIKNKFPANVQPMNIHLYEIINRFQKWKSEESKQ